MAGHVHTDGRGIVRCEAGEAVRNVVGRCVVQGAVAGCALPFTNTVREHAFVRVTISGNYFILVLNRANKRRDIMEPRTFRTREGPRIIVFSYFPNSGVAESSEMPQFGSGPDRGVFN